MTDDDVRFVKCPECGNEQADMGRGVACEECGHAPMPYQPLRKRGDRKDD
jgi:DNA-directed RNA polymerase subunit RPC12/RpoP